MALVRAGTWTPIQAWCSVTRASWRRCCTAISPASATMRWCWSCARGAEVMTLRILKLAVGTELDVVAARQRAREIAVQCKFPMQDQVRIATSVSELARNVYNYAQGGKVEFSIEEDSGKQVLQIRIDDQGPGFGNLDEILGGRYQSK